MTALIIFWLLFTYLPEIQTIRVPVIRNITLVGLSSENSTIYRNMTCDKCLCQWAMNSSVLNCFPNRTCQIFPVAPRRYRIAAMNDASLIFPTGVLPNNSRCCMPNTTELLMKLANGTQQQVNVNHPRCLVLTDNGLLATVSFGSRYLLIYDSSNLSLRMQVRLNTSVPYTLSHHAGAYYVGLGNNNMLAIDSTSFQILNNINSSAVSGPRNMIFLDGGETMVVASFFTANLLFFKLVKNSRHNYTFDYYQSVNYMNPHGLLYMNDTFFYATSWHNNSIYSYEKMNETWWKETLVIRELSRAPPQSGCHVTIDECGRFWFSLKQAGTLIYSQNGTYEGSLNFTSNTQVFDTILTKDYALFFSDTGSGRIVRLDPHIQC